MRWIILPFILYSCILISQNLVPNPSFEIYSTCPHQGGQIDFADGWFKTTRHSSDYFNSCSVNFSVPINATGFQYANTGVAYAGIYCFSNSHSAYRDYISIELIDTLIANSIYRISFYASLSDTSMFGINSLAAFVSDFNPYKNIGFGVLSSYKPQIIDENTMLTESTNWIKIEGLYNAIGAESFITIGNFNIDAQTMYQLVNPNTNQSHTYYYIDDVSVIKLPDHDVNMDTITYNSNCYSDSSSIKLRFQNTGTKELDFTVDTVTFTTEVMVNGTLVQNFDFEFSDNNRNPVPGAPLAADSFMSIEIFPVDLGRLGELHEITVISSFKRDEVSSNDTASMEITPMLDVGEMSVFPLKVCSGEEVSLQTQNFIGDPVWQYSTDGKNWHNLTAGASASHKPTYSTFYRLEICGFLHSDSVLVEVPLIRPPQNYYDTACENTSLKIELVIDAAVQELRWFDQIDDLIHTGFSNEVFLNGSKTFYVQAKEQDCWSEERAVVSIHAEECPLVIPNIFTPNGDGTNDLFIIGSSEGKELKTTIHNRWGEEVANFKGNEGWDGAGLPDGVYFYIVREMKNGTVHKTHKGEVMIVR